MAQQYRFRAWHAAAFLLGVSAVSVLSTSKGGRAYWRGLRRSPRSPPRWVFPSVWALLNGLQLWADLRILNDRESPDRKTVIGLRAVNWLLYALFTPAFFRAQSPIAGEVVTLAEGVTAGATVAILARSDPLAAAAIVPLTLWTAYAGIIGGGSAATNPDDFEDRLRWGEAF